MFRGYAQQVGPQHKHAIITKMVIFFFPSCNGGACEQREELELRRHACLVSVLVI